MNPGTRSGKPVQSRGTPLQARSPAWQDRKRSLVRSVSRQSGHLYQGNGQVIPLQTVHTTSRQRLPPMADQTGGDIVAGMDDPLLFPFNLRTYGLYVSGVKYRCNSFQGPVQRFKPQRPAKVCPHPAFKILVCSDSVRCRLPAMSEGVIGKDSSHGTDACTRILVISCTFPAENGSKRLAPSMLIPGRSGSTAGARVDNAVWYPVSTSPANPGPSTRITS